MSLRVAHVITGLETGGAEVLLARLVENLDSERAAGPVISLTTRGRLADRIEAAGTKVTALGLPSTPGPRGVATLRRALVDANPDVIQTWLLHANVLGALAASTIRNVPLAWGVHMSAAEPGTHGRTTIALQKVEKAMSLRLPAVIVACSETARDEMLERGYSRSRVKLVPNGFDTGAFRPDAADRQAVRSELGIPEEAPVVGHFARYHPMKDHANMIAAASATLKRLPDAVFLLCGAGVDESNPELSALASSLGGSVRLLGERSDVPRVLRALDLAALSSSTGEALPLVIGEAMASGVPFVATRVGDAEPIIGDTGRVVPPRDPGALGNAVADLLELPGPEREALSAAARQRIIDQYGLGPMVDAYVGTWEEISA